VRRLVRGLELSEADALVAGPDPHVEGVIGVPVDAAIPRARMASRLHCSGAISVRRGKRELKCQTVGEHAWHVFYIARTGA
jgi:hypothetical protein